MATSTVRAPRTSASASGRETPAGVPGLLPSAGMAAVAAAAVVLSGLLVVSLLAWAFAPGAAGAAAPARIAVWAWLASLRVPLEVHAGPTFRLGLVPLGLTCACVVALYQAGRWTARRAGVTTAPRAVEAALALGASYAACCGLAAGAAGGVVRPDPLASLVMGWLVGAVAGGLGAAGAAGVLEPAVARLRADVRAVVRAASASGMALIGGGSVVVAVSLLVHAGRVGSLTDVGGGPVLVLLAAAYAPTAAVWGMAYGLGPGFAVGAGTVAGPFGVHLGAVPALPLLGALPADAAGTTAGAWTLVLPVAACAVGGWLLGRALPLPPAAAAVRALALAPLLAVAGMLAAWLAGGAVGPGRLAVTGPSPWQTGLALGVVALLAAPAAAYEARRRAS